MCIPTSSWACTTNSWAAAAQRTGADLPATLVCWQLGILHQQLGLLGRLPASLAFSAGFRLAWRLSDPSGAATASTLGFCCVCGAARARHWLRDGRTGGRVARDGRASRDVSWTVHVPTFESSHCQWADSLLRNEPQYPTKGNGEIPLQQSEGKNGDSVLDGSGGVDEEGESPR